MNLLNKLAYLFCLATVLSCTPEAATSEQAIVANSTYKSITPSDSHQAYQVAFLIMDGVFNTELTAPFDIFHHTVFREHIRPMRVFTIADQSQAVTTFEGLKIIPDFNYLEDDFPKIDILVVPSAEHHMDTDLKNQPMLDFVQKTANEALYVTSHCDGAFILAKAGVLNGHASTTFPSDIEAYRMMFPELEVYDNVLFVHDEKYITSAGGAKSFEAALYLCELLYGKSVADQLAKGLVIDWDLSKVPHAVIGAKG